MDPALIQCFFRTRSTGTRLNITWPPNRSVGSWISALPGQWMSWDHHSFRSGSHRSGSGFCWLSSLRGSVATFLEPRRRCQRMGGGGQKWKTRHCIKPWNISKGCSTSANRNSCQPAWTVCQSACSAHTIHQYDFPTPGSRQCNCANQYSKRFIACCANSPGSESAWATNLCATMTKSRVYKRKPGIHENEFPSH